MKLKRLVSLLLVLCLCFTTLQPLTIQANAAAGLTLDQLRQKFPHGKYWNGGNADSYTTSPCNHHRGGCRYNGSCGCNSFLGLSIQCMGYAEKLGYDATGSNPRNNANGWCTYTSSSALDNLKPGDIVRYRNNGHSIYVTGVNGDTVTYTDCNSDGHCIIRWDVTISKSTLRSSFTHVRSAPSSVSPGPISCSCSTSYAGTYICTTSSLNLTIRSGHGSSYSAIGSIPPGAIVTVSKASGTSSSDWAHVTYNGVTGYASMQYLSKKQVTQERNSRIGLWLSDSEMGGSISTIRTGEWLYLCYKLYDSNTGDLLDTYNTSGGYTVKLTLYETNGAVAHTYTFTNDNNWISIKRATPGNYKGELVFTWNSGGTTTSSVSINMVYEPRVTPSASDIQLDVTETNSQTISISYSGATSSNSIYLDCTTSGDCFSYKWGSWSDHKMPLTITGVRAGQGTITIEMYDSDTDQIIATSKVYVTVTAPTYTVSYNANGGSGAPSSQTKYHNTALTLSNTKPTRTGYTFLGWATSSTATGATYQPGDSFTGNANKTLYAVWKIGCEGNKHKYSYSVTGKPTVTSTGKIVGECGYCGSATSVLLPKLNTNDYTYKVTKAATCTATGTGRYTWKTTAYGTFYFEVTIAKAAHSWKAATCTSAQTCSVCGTTSGSALGHSYSYRITKAPTASATGILTGTCSKCNGTATVTLPKLTTTDYTYKVTKAATCTAAGTGRYTWKTTAYGSFYFNVTITKAAHSWQAAACTSAQTCSVCGATNGSALGHTVGMAVKENKVAASCKSAGSYDSVVRCSDCGEELSRETIAVEKLAHSYSNGCDRFCDVCGATRTVGSHKYTNDGDTTCNDCGAYAYPGGNTLVKENGTWYHVMDRQKVSGTTLVKFNGIWFYVKNGVVDFSATTLFKFNGYWFYIKNGQINYTDTLVKFNGYWFHVKNGQINYDPAIVPFNGYRFYTNNGQIEYKSGLTKVGGTWYYLKNGQVDNTNTLVKFNGIWFHVKNGVIDYNPAIVPFNGYRFYTNNGQIQYKSGLTKVGGTWYYLKSGQVDNSNTLVKFNGIWFHVKNGVIDYSNTLVKFNGYTFYVNNGQVSFITGYVKVNGRIYYAIDGIVKV